MIESFNNYMIHDPYQVPTLVAGFREPYAELVVYELDNDPTPAKLDELYAEYPDYDLKYGARCGVTALTIAILSKALPLVRHILDKDPSLVNGGWGENSEPYLVTASWVKGPESFEIVKEFISRGANVNLANRKGMTALFESSLEKTKNEITKFLLQHGGRIYRSVLERVLPTRVTFQISNQQDNLNQALTELGL